MRIAEVLLKLGSALVAWMVIYAYIVWLGVLHKLGCGPDGAEMHRLLLIMAPLAAMSAVALRLTHSMDDIHQMLRWLRIPLLVLLPFCGMSIWGVFAAVNLGSGGICESSIALSWEKIWAPLQTATLIFCGWKIATAYRPQSPATGS